MHDKINRSLATLLVGLLLVGVLVMSPQSSGAGRGAQITISVGEDDYPNVDNQNQVPVAVNNTHRFTLSLSNPGDADDNFSIEATFNNPQAGWDDTFINVGQSGGSNYGMELNASETKELTVDVMAPPMALLGQEGEVQLTATGEGSNATEVIYFSVEVRNWTAYMAGMETFAFGDDHDYDITIVNLNSSAAFESDKWPIELRLSAVDPGWRLRFPEDGKDRDQWPENATYSNPLPAGGTVTVTMNVELEDNVQAADDTEFRVQASNEIGPFANLNLIVGHAKVLPHYAPQLSADTTQATVDTAGGTATFELTVTNFGNIEDSFTISMDDSALPAGWSANLDKTSTALLDCKGTGCGNNRDETFNVTITAPAREEAMTEGVVTITATSDSDPAGSPASTSRDLSLSVTQEYAISLSTPAATTAEVLPGQMTTFAITIDNGGNGDDTVELAVSGGSFWNPMLKQATVTVTNVTVGSYDNDSVVLAVTAPADADHTDSSGDIVVTATSEDGTTTDSLTFSATAGQVFGLELTNGTNVTSITKQQGQVASFSLLVRNTGNGQDTIALALSDGPSYITLKSGTSAVAAISVNAHSEVTITVEGTIPVDTPTGTVTLTITGTSEDTTTTDDYSFTLTVEEKSVIVPPDDDDTTDDDDDDGPLPGFEAAFMALGVLAALGLMGRRRR